MGVAQGTIHHQIHRPAEDRFQLLLQVKVVLKQRRPGTVRELHDQVDVTARRIKTVTGGRAEDIQTQHFMMLTGLRNGVAEDVQAGMREGIIGSG